MKEINPTDVYDELFNVTILGTPKSGKKALLSKFINGVVFPIDFINVTLTIDSKSIKLRIYLIDDLWSLRSCNAAIVCCDLTKKEQLTTIQTYVKKIREQFYQGFPEKPIIIVGTKADLAIQQEINEIELSKEAEKLGCKCFITSAKTGKGIEQMFSNLVKSIMQAKEKFEEVEKAAESRNNPLNDSSSRSWCLLS